MLNFLRARAFAARAFAALYPSGLVADGNGLRFLKARAFASRVFHPEALNGGVEAIEVAAVLAGELRLEAEFIGALAVSGTLAAELSLDVLIAGRVPVKARAGGGRRRRVLFPVPDIPTPKPRYQPPIVARLDAGIALGVDMLAHVDPAPAAIVATALPAPAAIDVALLAGLVLEVNFKGEILEFDSDLDEIIFLLAAA